MRERNVRRKGFTLIELIVVMAVLAILVLLAAPRFIGKTEEAKLTHIQNDIRVAENKISEALATEPDFIETWETTERAELEALVNENQLLGLGGPVLEAPSDDVKIVDDAFLDQEIRSKLTGDFFVDGDGNVFYEHNKAVAGDNDETPPKPSEKPIPDYYVQATDTDFKEDSEGYWRYIGSDDYVILPHEINGVPVTSYRYMFYGTPYLGVAAAHPVKGVVSTNPNVTDMYAMFRDSHATTLDLSSFNTANVTDMYTMFHNSAATNLNLNNFNTAKVTNMGFMFSSSQATSLDLSSFNTANVTTMLAMFQNSQATSLDLSSFNTANVTTMQSMFNGSRATTLDLSNFDTSNVTDMWGMFTGSQATTLDLSSFDISKVTDMSYMFNHAKATTGYARNTDELSRFNSYITRKPDTLTFTVK